MQHDPTNFPTRIAERVSATDSILSVGLDPVIERLPADIETTDPVAAIEAFTLGVLEATQHRCAAVKFQSACYERYAADGFAVLERTIAAAKFLGHLVILDAKRGDIGISVDHYAAAAQRLQADAITAHAYAGVETLRPFLDRGLAIFPLVRTSNPEGDAFQSIQTNQGRTVAQSLAVQVAKLGNDFRAPSGISAVGAVVGVTKAAHEPNWRDDMPDQIFLMPGLGAQGGAAADARPLLRQNARSLAQAGLLISASRSVIYPPSGNNDWRSAIASAAETHNEQLRALTPVAHDN